MTLLRPPERLMQHHELSEFDNGRHPSLDDWLKQRAMASEGHSARTYVVCPESAPMRVIGYFCIATAMEQRSALPSARLRQGMPDQVPLLLIGRLAVDRSWRSKGLGSALLCDAIRRCLAAAEIAGARAIVTHAIDDEAASFYAKHGFRASPLAQRVMLMPMDSARGAFQQNHTPKNTVS
jgi:GNAT superfamily N-acetyltransferase